MSVSITLHCDREWQYGGCTSRLITDAATIAEARQAASNRGWRSHPDGSDYCPTCSGSSSPRRTNVIHLRQEDDPA